MNLYWTFDATEALEMILTYIAQDNPRAAAKMGQRFLDAVNQLLEYPKIGHPGKVDGTRELIPHPSYRIVYEVDEEKSIVWILTIVHTARQWPPIKK